MAPPNSQLVAMAVARARQALLSRYDKSAGPLLPLGARQEVSRKDRGPPDSVWTAPVEFPSPPEDSARTLVLQAVRELGKPGIRLPPLDSASIAAEWLAAKREPEPGSAISPRERFNALTTESMHKGTIIYVHGGAFFQNGIATSRSPASKLSKLSGSRVIIPDYRLAPQHPFPSQILDLLILYLSLLYPPPGSFHEPVTASSIVIAGESAGACLSLGFLQLLLFLQKHSVQFHGEARQVPMPAGFATVSNSGDQGLCLPSWRSNSEFDIWGEKAPYLDPDFPADDIWPSSPPREDVYCGASLLSHPMVSPVTAESWEGAPPMWFAIGQERLADSSKVIAQTAHQQGVCVIWNQYEAMPHCWMFIVPKFPHTRDLWTRWAKACSELIRSPRSQSRGAWIEVEDLREIPISLDNLTSLEPAQAARMIEEKAMLTPVFYGQKSKPQL